jgi:hypothetical protein
MNHEWGPSRLNHGNQQCIHCHCTDLEAKFALGPECPKRDKPKPNPLKLVGGTDAAIHD